MRSLFRLFSRMILKVTGIYMVSAFAGVLILDKLFGGWEFYLGMLVFIAPLLAWAETFMLVPKNLDWIMSLPISKRNVLVLHYMTSVFASVSNTVATFIVLIALALVKSDHQISLGKVASAAPAFVNESQVKASVVGMDVYGWMTVLLMLSFFHALAMSISRPVTTKRLYLNLWNHNVPAIRWGIRIGWLGVIGFSAAMREYFLSPFGIFFVATLVFLFLTTFNTSHALGIFRNQRRRWMTASAAIAGVQIAFLFTHAMTGVRSSEFNRRVASVMFLGPFSGGIARPDLGKLLEADIHADRVQELGEHFKKKFTDGGKIGLALANDVSFRRAIATKKNYEAVSATLSLFDPSMLTFEDLKVLFDKLQVVLPECRCEFNPAELLQAKVHWSEVEGLLKSNNEAAVSFALLWARYNGKPADGELVPAIERSLAKYSDTMKLSALKTLSVLEGHRYTFDHWVKSRGSANRSLSSKFDMKCSDWTPKTAAELSLDDAPALNFCIRKKAEPAQITELESLGWIEPPFDARERAVVRKILRVK